MVEPGHPELSLGVQAALLGLSRSSLYYQPRSPSPQEVALKHRIDELYTAHPYYGSRRIAAVLRQEGQVINRKAVQRHMQEMGIAGVAPGPHTSRRHPTHPVYPYLLRQLSAAHPNHVWGIDITYVRLQGGWLYLVAWSPCSTGTRATSWPGHSTRAWSWASCWRPSIRRWP
jgi:putative transposase